jgi:hypothetical protein
VLTTVLTMQQRNEVKTVGQTPEAEQLLNAFDEECDARINRSGAVASELYNRAHLHALKVAALVAVGWNHQQAIVAVDHARWAIDLARRSVASVLQRFERGDTGGSKQARAEARVRALVVRFLKMTSEERAREDESVPLLMRTGPYFPRAYLAANTRRVQPFKEGQHVLSNTLNEMVRNGELRRLSEVEARQRFRSRGGEIYELGPNWK